MSLRDACSNRACCRNRLLDLHHRDVHLHHRDLHHQALHHQDDCYSRVDVAGAAGHRRSLDGYRDYSASRGEEAVLHRRTEDEVASGDATWVVSAAGSLPDQTNLPHETRPRILDEIPVQEAVPSHPIRSPNAMTFPASLKSNSCRSSNRPTG